MLSLQKIVVSLWRAFKRTGIKNKNNGRDIK